MSCHWGFSKLYRPCNCFAERWDEVSHLGLTASSMTCTFFQPCFCASSFCAKTVSIYLSSIWYEVPFIWNEHVLSRELYLHDLHIFLFTFFMYFDRPDVNWTSYFSWYSSTNWKPSGNLRINVGIGKKKGGFSTIEATRRPQMDYVTIKIRPNLRDKKGFASKVEEKCFRWNLPLARGVVWSHDTSAYLWAQLSGYDGKYYYWDQNTITKFRPSWGYKGICIAKVEEKCFSRKPPSSPGRRLISRHDVLICELNPQLWRHEFYTRSLISCSNLLFELHFWLALDCLCSWLALDCLCSWLLLTACALTSCALAACFDCLLWLLVLWLSDAKPEYDDNTDCVYCLIVPCAQCDDMSDSGVYCFATNVMTQKNVWLCWAQYDDTTSVWLPDEFRHRHGSNPCDDGWKIKVYILYFCSSKTGNHQRPAHLIITFLNILSVTSRMAYRASIRCSLVLFLFTGRNNNVE